MNPERRRLLLLQPINEENNFPLNSEQLKQVAKLNPLKKDDFKAIVGLGDTFIENYSDIFLEALRVFNQESIKNKVVDNTLSLTLNELEKKLINISSSNRLLQLSRLSKNSSFDLYTEEKSLFFDFLYHNKPLTLVDLSQIDKENEHQLISRYKNATTLIKNIEKQQRETGQNDFFVGYPFVTGKFVEDPFVIRAPLALFPVKSHVTNNKVMIQIDEERDVYINSNLLVAKAKFTQDMSTLPDSEWQEVNPQTFVQDLIDFYQLQNLTIEPSDETLVSFQDKKAAELSALPFGKFEIEPIAILGHFPNHASSIQRDFNKITHQTNLPKHLDVLLSTLDEQIDYLEPSEKLPEINYSEKDLVFINSLNASQETAQIAIKKGHSLVIEGPPGTGKSQTITNIIADALDANKNILMVSEKKAAIDVVYSRLGHLNNYTLILDNMNDKVRFYDQLAQLYQEKEHIESMVSLEDLDGGIELAFRELEDLYTILIQSTDDESLLTLYSEVSKMDYTSDNGYQKYKRLRTLALEYGISSNYRELKSILQTLDVEWLDQQLTLKKLPVIRKLNKQLRPFDIKSLKEDLALIDYLQQQEQQSSFLKKLFGKKDSVTKLDQLKFTLFNDSYIDVDINDIQTILNNYDKYRQVSGEHASALADLLDIISKEYEIDFDESKRLILNFVGFEKLDSFEAAHKELITLMADFEAIIHSINHSHNVKAKTISQNLSIDLKTNVLRMIQSKRSQEMLRIIERKRKWSIRKFIDKFSLELFNGIKVWLCTPDVVSEIFPLKSDLFDLVIFDEASQMYIERAIPSLYRGTQVVIAGDSKQLRPSSLGVGRLYFDDMSDEFIENTAALDEESLLDLARFKYPNTILNYHYRSVYEELIAFSNAAFYQNELIMSPAVQLPDKPVIEVINVSGQWNNRQNKIESIKVIEIIQDVLFNRKANETLGVITFNASQMKLIEEDLMDACEKDSKLHESVMIESNRIEDGEDKSLFIKNIENVQGDERDIIIFSIAYGKNEEGKVSTNFGWLNQQGGENRLNVAITRSKKKIYVVTSIEPHELNVSNSKYAGPRRLRDYLEYCYAVSNSNETLINSILKNLYQQEKLPLHLDSENQLITRFVKKLNDKGFDTILNLGLASYTIDLAIKQNDVYKLAIFFDSTRYQIEKTRVRDLHLDNYLRARGWRVKRIFTRNLFDNMDSVINEVVQMVNKKDD